MKEPTKTVWDGPPLHDGDLELCKMCWRKKKITTYLPRGEIRAHLQEEHWKKDDAVNKQKYSRVPVSRPAKHAAFTTPHASHAAASACTFTPRATVAAITAAMGGIASNTRQRALLPSLGSQDHAVSRHKCHSQCEPAQGYLAHKKPPPPRTLQ